MTSGMAGGGGFNVIIQRESRPRPRDQMSGTNAQRARPSFSPSCPVVLSAPDTVLIERNLGKRVDPHNGGTATPRHPTPRRLRDP